MPCLYCGLWIASLGRYDSRYARSQTNANSAQSTEIRSTMVPKHVQAYTQPILIVLNMVLLFNIGTALLPLAKQKDNLTDIPLTPTQRALLGLDPNITPSSTPTSQYITPPRYPRSPTPRTSSPGSRSGSNSDSPLSRKENSLGRQENNSPYSPSASPMWQKAVGGSRESTRRNSYGTPSPLGRNFGGKDASVLGVPSTPSPSIGRGASVGLNSKWLYERGRASPRSSGIYS